MTDLRNISLNNAMFHGTRILSKGQPLKGKQTEEGQYIFSSPIIKEGMEITLFFNSNDPDKTTLKGRYSFIGTPQKGDLIFHLMQKTFGDRIIFEGEASGYERVRFYLSFPS